MYRKLWFGLRIFLVCDCDVSKKKWQINILENQLILCYSVQPKGIVTQTLILVDLLWVCCCYCFQFESSLLLARNIKTIGGLVGVGERREKRGKQLMMTLCLEELVEIGVRSQWHWCSHIVPHPTVLLWVLTQHVTSNTDDSSSVTDTWRRQLCVLEAEVLNPFRVERSQDSTV